MAFVVSSSAFADDAGSAAPSGPAAVVASQGAAISGASLPTALSPAGGPAPEGGVPFGLWMVYPSIFVGGLYNSNIYQTSASQASGFGARITPNLEADLDAGIHKATVYATADAILYPGQNSYQGQSPNTISGRAGVAYVYSPTSDVTAHFSTDFTRQEGVFGSTLASFTPVGTATSFVSAPMSVSSVGYLQFSNVTSVNLSVEKELTALSFVRLAAGGQNFAYDAPPVGNLGFQNGNSYTASVRGGYWVTALVNAYVEVGGNLWRGVGSSYYDTNGYRAVLGFASDLISLFRGEIYGGVQQQFSTQGNFAAATAPAFGGSLTYYPTEYLTIALAASNYFAAAGAYGAGASLSNNNVTFQTRLQADYKLFEYWQASARVGFANTRYLGINQTSQTWLGGAGVAYNFWRNFAWTLDYQYTNSVSNGSGAGPSYADNLVTMGVTYKY